MSNLAKGFKSVSEAVNHLFDFVSDCFENGAGHRAETREEAIELLKEGQELHTVAGGDREYFSWKENE